MTVLGEYLLNIRTLYPPDAEQVWALRLYCGGTHCDPTEMARTRDLVAPASQ